MILHITCPWCGCHVEGHLDIRKGHWVECPMCKRRTKPCGTLSNAKRDWKDGRYA